MAKTIQRRRWSVNGQPDPSETPKSQVGKDAGAYLVWLQQRSHVILLNHRQIAERNTQINWWIAQDTYRKAPESYLKWLLIGRHILGTELKDNCKRSVFSIKIKYHHAEDAKVASRPIPDKLLHKDKNINNNWKKIEKLCVVQSSSKYKRKQNYMSFEN